MEPGAIENIVCVAATDQADGLAGFSDWGAESVDLGAPGTEILSTYPVTNAEFSEDFQANDFASNWTNSGSGFGRAAAGDGPLTSFGMNDSPGAAPAANSVHQTTTTTGVTVPAGTGSCILSGLRLRSPDSGSTFSYSVLSDDSRDLHQHHPHRDARLGDGLLQHGADHRARRPLGQGQLQLHRRQRAERRKRDLVRRPRTGM